MSDAKLLSVDGDLALASWRTLFICIWRYETKLDGVQRTWEAMKAFALAQPNGMGLLTIVESNAPMPDKEPRDTLAELMRSFSADIKASALVFEGQGFKAAAVRSIVTGINLLAKTPYPHRVVDSVRTAATWLPAQLATPTSVAMTSEEMEFAVDKLRMTIPPLRPRQDLAQRAS